MLDAPPPTGADAFPLDALHYIHAHCPRLRELETHNVRLPVLGVHTIPAPLDYDDLSHDKSYNNMCRNDSLSKLQGTLRGISDMLDWVRRTRVASLCSCLRDCLGRRTSQ